MTQTQYEIGIAWLGDIDDDSVVEIETREQPPEKIPDSHCTLLVLESPGHFVKNFTDCVFIQLKSDILDKRNYLLKQIITQVGLVITFLGYRDRRCA